MILEIRELLENARKNVAQQVNTQLLTTYWNIGRIIVEYEQQNQIRADYGKQTLRELSKELTREFGKGFSRSNLQNMRAFYLAYEKCQTVSGKLSWSHYCELLSITDENKRSFYEKESNEKTCHRSISSFLFRHLGVISFSLTAENSAPTKSSAPSTNSSLFHISSARTSASARDPARITTVLCRVSVISTSNSFMDTPQSMQMQVNFWLSTIRVTL